jgi:hypothetical protein
MQIQQRDNNKLSSDETTINLPIPAATESFSNPPLLNVGCNEA